VVCSLFSVLRLKAYGVYVVHHTYGVHVVHHTYGVYVLHRTDPFTATKRASFSFRCGAVEVFCLLGCGAA
jgi:hypothetical protein